MTGALLVAPKRKPAGGEEFPKKKEPTSLRLPPETVRRINLIAKWKGVPAHSYIEPMIRAQVAKDWAEFKQAVQQMD